MEATGNNTPTAETQKKPAQPLGPTGLEPAEYRRNQWIATAAKGVRAEDLLQPDYWAHVAAKLAPWNKIEVRAEDGLWYAEAIVLDCSRNWARIALLPGYPLFLTSSDISQTQSAPAGYEVVHRGPKKWSVIRAKDHAVMHEGEQTKTGAADWLKQNAESLPA